MVNLSKMYFNFILLAKNRDKWINKNKFFYQNDWDYMKFLISPNHRLTDTLCGNKVITKANYKKNCCTNRQ